MKKLLKKPLFITISVLVLIFVITFFIQNSGPEKLIFAEVKGYNYISPSQTRKIIRNRYKMCDKFKFVSRTQKRSLLINIYFDYNFLGMNFKKEVGASQLRIQILNDLEEVIQSQVKRLSPHLTTVYTSINLPAAKGKYTVQFLKGDKIIALGSIVRE